MARYPKALWRPLRENSTEPFVKATQLIFHSAVSKSDSLFSFFEQRGVVVESHFYVQKDGEVEQYIDTARQADANYRANIRALSVESWDNRDPDHVPWNSDQLASLAAIAAWAHRVHDIPLVRAKAWDAPGMGGHTDYPQWSNVRGKTCPGIIRKPQVDHILGMANTILGGGDPAPRPANTRVPDRARTKRIQLMLELPADGYWGRNTDERAILMRNAASTHVRYPHNVPVSFNVRNVQTILDVRADGIWGPKTQSAFVLWVRALQAVLGVDADGIWGPNTDYAFVTFRKSNLYNY